ncbi:hypothetical protein K402DRAFT_407875 [Aulographum hederae CBS 113979]|uniref:DNA damage-binding protein 1 n=1 Tax=Aulographum hederae CBS 113979 TaxID=1176131 RepID=A0A6G1GMR8_9PEZI|nr:hypothetical protein K402DRAFT_407875 [Aulographum hederae CBS 113979]
MAYLAPIHRPSCVRNAIKLHLLSPDEEHLVVAKANRLEIYAQSEQGLVLAHSKTIYGRVVCFNKIRPASSTTDHLVIGTDRLAYFTVSWDPESKQLKTEKSCVDLAVKSLRVSQTSIRCLVDPSGKFMTLEMFEGVVTVVPLQHKNKRKQEPADPGNLGEATLSRIPELFVRSSAFVPPRFQNEKNDKPKLALIYEDSSGKVWLRVRHLAYTPSSAKGEAGSAELDDGPIPKSLELGAAHLIPMTLPTGGLLIVSETSVSFYNDETDQLKTVPLEEATVFVAWERIDDQRFILADDYGYLYMIMLMLDNRGTVRSWNVEKLGRTSHASTLIYLGDGHVFLGSAQGDSQVISIQNSSIEVVQTFSNVGPILDFTVMDMGNRAAEGQTHDYSSGQARIVTGSGAWNDGSLRSIRSGVGLEDLGSLGETERITRLFSLSSGQATDGYVDTLVASSMDETRIFSFSPEGDITEVDEFFGFSLTEETLHADNLTNGNFVQFTTSSVRITDIGSGMTLSEWTPPAGQHIHSVTMDEYIAILSVGDDELVVLELADTIALNKRKNFPTEGQVSCVTLSAKVPGACVVGFWEQSKVYILNLDTLDTIREVSLNDDGIVPKSLLITNIFVDQSPVLLVAMADGTVVTFHIDPTKYDLSSRKSIVLGSHQPEFKVIPRNENESGVFATCEHPSLIYGEEGRLVYSAITAQNAICVCPFNTSAFPGSIAIATADDIRVGLVDSEKTTHVQSLAFGETVRRVAYSASLRAFGLGTIQRHLDNGVEVVVSRFKLADEILFKELDTYELNADEMVESVLRCELDDGTGELAERFVVGTSYLEENEDDGSKGRIIVFEVTDERLLKKVTELSVKGACRVLEMVDGRIVAALMKTVNAVYRHYSLFLTRRKVVIYSLDYPNSQPQLTKLTSFRTSTAPVGLTSRNRMVAVADLMKSVSLVEFNPGVNGTPDKLREVARHYSTLWATAVAHFAPNTYLESDAEGNLIVLERETKGVTEADMRSMRVLSEISLGEMVNQIREVDVKVPADTPVAPKAFLATVEGSIYLVGAIAESHLNLLMQLQANMADCLQSIGNVPFNQYRAFKSHVREADEPFRFVDGDLIERFLNLEEDVQERCVVGLGEGVGIEEVKVVVEKLKRLH